MRQVWKLFLGMDFCVDRLPLFLIYFLLAAGAVDLSTIPVTLLDENFISLQGDPQVMYWLDRGWLSAS